MTNKKQFVYDVEKVEEFGFGDFQFISSWDLNYKSWKVQKKIPLKFIKYEDLLKETFFISKEIIKFINDVTNNKEKINIAKLKNTLQTTSFSKLKNNEIKYGFSEAVNSQKNKQNKIKFFNLGPENDWRKILNDNLRIELDKIFEKEIKELMYK